MPLTPERAVREKVGLQLSKCGWDEQSHSEMEFSATPGTANGTRPMNQPNTSGWSDGDWQ